MPKPALGALHQADGAVKNAERAIKAAGDALAMVASAADAEPFEILPLLSAAAKRIQDAASESARRIAAAELRAETDADRRRESYGERLRNALEAEGLKTDGTSSNFAIEGRVFLAYDSRSGELRLNDERVQDLRVGLVVEAIKERLALLSKCATPTEDFGRMLAAAYDREINLSGKQPGDQVRVDVLHSQLVWARQTKAFHKTYKGAAYREYTPEMLRTDLHALLASGAAVPDGRLVRADSGADPSGALWMYVPALERTGFVGRIRLVAPSE